MAVHHGDGAQEFCLLRGSDTQEQRRRQINRAVAAAIPPYLTSGSTVDEYGVIYVGIDFQSTVSDFPPQLEGGGRDMAVNTSREYNMEFRVCVNEAGLEEDLPYNVTILQGSSDSTPTYTLHFADLNQAPEKLARAIEFGLALGDNVYSDLLGAAE